MSNLIYDPDGNPIPQEKEDTPSEQQQEKTEEQQQAPSPKIDIPYPLFVSQFHEEYSEPDIQPQLPFIRNSLEAAALISGIVSILMIFYPTYQTLFVMFGAGLAAVILAALSYKGYAKNRKVCAIALTLGALGVFLFLYEMINMIIIAGNPKILDYYLELYEETYGLPDSPINIQDLF